MAQQTELEPLSPSVGDLFDAWWAPFRFLLRIGMKLAVPALPMLILWDTSKGAIADVPVGTFESTASMMTTTAETMFAFFPVVIGGMVLITILSMTRRSI